MALQTTGKISLSDIQTLFGGTNPITMSEYYNNNASGFTTGVTGIPNSGATISISHFYGKAKPSASSLYGFTAHTFTNAGATGRTGPIISQVRSAYSTASWAQNSTYLNMTTQGIQEWTVPATGSYTIASLGALGAGTGSYYGGNGANITGTFNLTKGDVLCIVIGQKGITGPNSGGAGGGGSFVYRKTDNLLYIVAGGGGGGGHDVGFGGGGSANQTPVNGGGSGNGGYQGIGYGGNGGGNSTNYVNSEWNDSAGGGGGWLSNGNNGGAILNMDYIGYGGYGRSSGFIGGYHATANTNGGAGNGGFGGGGGSGGNGSSGGGGGGYTGGGGGNNWPGSGNPGHGGGQGGGSYNTGTSQTNTASANTGDGSVTITPNFVVATAAFSIASIANLVLWHNGYNIDGSNNSTLSSGTAISSWYNSGSDSSLTTTQITSSYRPTYTLNGAVFSSGKSLISNINLNLSTYTIMNLFIVWKKTQSSNTLKWLWSQDNGGYDRTLIINADSSLYVGTGDGAAASPSYSFPINSVVIVNCEYNSSGQTGYFFVNNTSITTFSNVTASGTTSTQFGSNGGGSNSIDGVIHEILVISRVLTTTERTNIYNALLAKY